MSLPAPGPAPSGTGGIPPYAPRPGARDEMLAPDGGIRPHWATLSATFDAYGAGWLHRHDLRIRRTLEAHGTTFQIHGDGDPAWALDPVPVVITADEWRTVAAGIEQRARLLDAVLADLQGSRRLLRDGVVPPDVVLRDPELLHACRDIPTARHLVFHAADLVRTPDGSFRVLADRCEAPSGMGYALENREVIARTFPELVRRTGVRRLVGWFETVHATLAALAPPGVDDPRIVLFTGGPGSHTYFEHSFLARTLGYTLVEGDDLTVRGGSVWLKSVGGLEPVHVILRRVESRSADPLELDPTSGVGVAGLVEAARRGTVSIANPLGAAAVSNPALLPFLPALSRHLFGEDPILEPVPTFWCGDPASRSHVLANLHRMVLRPIVKPEGRASVFGRLLTERQAGDLARRIEADPELWVGQDEVPLPTTPAFVGGADDGRFEPWFTLQRTFAVATDDGYAVMDGALTRAGTAPDGITIFEGGASKDTWITDPATIRSLVPPRRALPQVDLRRSITSRVAESMFWIGRNLERAEMAVRLVVAVDRFLDQWPELAEESGGAWMRIVRGTVVDLVGETAPRLVTDDLDAVLTGAINDLSRPRSLATSLRFLLLGARTVRELFSTDSWRLLTSLDDVADDLPGADADTVVEIASQAITPLAGLSGLLHESMVRDPGWLFLDIGRRVERAQLGSTFLRSALGEPMVGWSAAPLHEMVLAAQESLVAYRRRHRSDIEPAALLSLLALDDTNPRSIRAAVDQLREDLFALPTPGERHAALSAVRAAGEADRRLGAADPVRLAGTGGTRAELDDLLGAVAGDLDEVVEAVTREYFTLVRATAMVGHLAQEAT